MIYVPPPLKYEVVWKRRIHDNSVDETQSCHILTEFYNQFNQLQILYYNIYSVTLFYTNILISTDLWGVHNNNPCALIINNINKINNQEYYLQQNLIHIYWLPWFSIIQQTSQQWKNSTTRCT